MSEEPGFGSTATELASKLSHLFEILHGSVCLYVRLPGKGLC